MERPSPIHQLDNLKRAIDRHQELKFALGEALQLALAAEQVRRYGDRPDQSILEQAIRWSWGDLDRVDWSNQDPSYYDPDCGYGWAARTNANTWGVPTREGLYLGQSTTDERPATNVDRPWETVEGHWEITHFFGVFHCAHGAAKGTPLIGVSHVDLNTAGQKSSRWEALLSPDFRGVTRVTLL